MALFGHGYLGLAIGAATERDPTSRLLRKAWLGGVVFLAYAPDVLEWAAQAAGFPEAGAVGGSLVVAVLLGMFFAGVAWGVLGERSPVALAVVVLTVGSHILLDMIEGGVPWLWPFSACVVGPDWIRITGLSLPHAWMRETTLFAPVVAAGVAVCLARARAPRWAVAIAVAGVVLGCVAAALGLFSAAALAIVGPGAIALYDRRPRLSAALWQAIPLTPLLALGALNGYTDYRFEQGRAAEKRKDYLAAYNHYRFCLRYDPIGSPAAKIECLGRVLLYRGEEAEAYDWLTYGREQFPHDFWVEFRLAMLYLKATDPQYHRPREALRLAEHLSTIATRALHRKAAARLLDRARAAVAHEAAETPKSAPAPAPSS